VLGEKRADAALLIIPLKTIGVGRYPRSGVGVKRSITVPQRLGRQSVRKNTRSRNPPFAPHHPTHNAGKDGAQWMISNLDMDTAPSYCHENTELNCHRYGRLYTWESTWRA
jgi:hypothetical protein